MFGKKKPIIKNEPAEQTIFQNGVSIKTKWSSKGELMIKFTLDEPVRKYERKTGKLCDYHDASLGDFTFNYLISEVKTVFNSNSCANVPYTDYMLTVFVDNLNSKKTTIRHAIDYSPTYFGTEFQVDDNKIIPCSKWQDPWPIWVGKTITFRIKSMSYQYPLEVIDDPWLRFINTHSYNGKTWRLNMEETLNFDGIDDETKIELLKRFNAMIAEKKLEPLQKEFSEECNAARAKSIPKDSQMKMCCDDWEILECGMVSMFTQGAIWASKSKYSSEELVNFLEHRINPEK